MSAYANIIKPSEIKFYIQSDGRPVFICDGKLLYIDKKIVGFEHIEPAHCIEVSPLSKADMWTPAVPTQNNIEIRYVDLAGIEHLDLIEFYGNVTIISPNSEDMHKDIYAEHSSFKDHADELKNRIQSEQNYYDAAALELFS